jgi:hypothetical protein
MFLYILEIIFKKSDTLYLSIFLHPVGMKSSVEMNDNGEKIGMPLGMQPVFDLVAYLRHAWALSVLFFLPSLNPYGIQIQ